MEQKQKTIYEEFSVEDLKNEINKEINICSGYRNNPGQGSTVAFARAHLGMIELQGRENKKIAQLSRKISVVALIFSIVAVLVGVIQISGTQKVNIVNPLEIKDGFIKTEVSNFPDSQNVKVSNDFLKTQIINWPN